MATFVSLAVGAVYGLFTAGVIGTPRYKQCLASLTSYKPFVYETQRQAIDFLHIEGSENVTKKFDFIILFGLISNAIYILFQMYKFSIQNQEGSKKRMMCAQVLIFLTWVT